MDKNIFITIANEIKLFFTYRSTIKGYDKIFKEQLNLIDTLEKREVEIYNIAVDKILGKTFKMTTFNGQPAFWHGKLGIKSVRQVPVYQANPSLIEVPVTFGGVDTTFYWYFYKLGEER